MNAHRQLYRSDRIDRINRNSKWQYRIGWTWLCDNRVPIVAGLVTGLLLTAGLAEVVSWFL